MLKIFNPFPEILAFLTGQKRYKPEITWSQTSWTHNVFRFYELIFWRKFGIRAEMSMRGSVDKNDRIISLTYRAHSLEAACALMEQYVRGFFKELEFVRIYVPKLAVAGNLFQPSPFLFAIAFDTTTQSSSASGATTFSFTCTGSQLSLVVNGGIANNGQTFTCTYNAVSMTGASAAITMNNSQQMQTFHLSGPATGANNIVFTPSGTSGGTDVAAGSYSGVKQTSQPSANNSDAPAASLNYSRSLTTVDDNSWIVAGSFANTAPSAGANTTIRQTGTNLGDGLSDTNSAQTPAGSKTLNWTSGNAGTTWGSFLIALSPALPPSGGTLTLMGV